MRNIKGFTLVEALVGMLILVMAIAGAMSFFIFGSTRATESFRTKSVDEVVASVINVITTDIRRAGYGVVGMSPAVPQVAIHVVNTLPTDELYVNHGDYLSLDGDIRAPTSDTASIAYRSINSVFKKNMIYTLSGNTLKYQGLIALTTSINFQLLAIPAIQGATHYNNIGAVIIANPASAAEVVVNGSVGVAGPLAGTQNWTFPLLSTAKDSAGSAVPVVVGMQVAPAISYRVIPKPLGGTAGLWRNRGGDVSPFGAPILGGDPFVDVTNFQVRCGYAGGVWADTNNNPANLRLLEVTISYQVKRGKGGSTTIGTTKLENWGPEVRRVITVCPRTLALPQF